MFKPLRMEDKIGCVTPLDPAINHEASDWNGYMDNIKSDPGGWRKYIKAKDGETVTEFIVGVIPSEHMVRMQDDCTLNGVRRGNEFHWRAFLHGLRDIKDWPTEVPKRMVGKVEYVDPEWIKNTFIRGLRQVAVNVGLVAIAFNQLTEDETKN